MNRQEQVTKTQENSTYNRAKRSVNSQQVSIPSKEQTTQYERQTRNANTKKGSTKEAQPWNRQ